MNEVNFNKALEDMRKAAIDIDAIQLHPDRRSSDRQVEERNQNQWETLLDALFDGYKNYKRCCARGNARA